MTTFTLMFKANMKANSAVALSLQALDLDKLIPLLKRMQCIHYLLYFKKNQTKIQIFINSNSEVNAMTPAYAKSLSF